MTACTDELDVVLLKSELAKIKKERTYLRAFARNVSTIVMDPEPYVSPKKRVAAIQELLRSYDSNWPQWKEDS